MEFALIVFGVQAGKLWARFVIRHLQGASATRWALTFQLCTCIAVAAITGVAIGILELHVFPPGRLASALSKGLIAGFAWSPWLVTNARHLHARRQSARAVIYLAVAPALVLTAVLGGYLSLHLGHRSNTKIISTPAYRSQAMSHGQLMAPNHG